MTTNQHGTSTTLHPSLIGEVVKLQIFDRDPEDETGDRLVADSLVTITGILEVIETCGPEVSLKLQGAGSYVSVDTSVRLLEVYHYPRQGERLNHIALDGDSSAWITDYYPSAKRKGQN